MATYQCYHGTCKNVSRLRIRPAYKYGFAGPALYFSDSVDDAKFYADVYNPDHDSKIDEEIARLQNRGFSYMRAASIIRSKYEFPRLFTCSVEINNPFLLDINNTRLQYIERKSFKRLQRILTYTELTQEQKDEIYCSLLDGVSSYELWKMISWQTLYIKRILKVLGFDGVILYNAHDWFFGYPYAASHYIIFKERQLRIDSMELLTT